MTTGITLTKYLALALCSFALAAQAGASSDTGPFSGPPHGLELELNSFQYKKILDARPDSILDADSQALKRVLDLGKRNLDLLIAVNKARDQAHHISLTSKATAQGYPVETPRVYNVAIILKAHDSLVAQVPAALVNLLKGTGQLGPSLPVSDEEYIKWGLLIDRSYQSAMRWLTLKPYRPSYIAARKNDIRGYHFLSREQNLSAELAAWDAQDATTLTRLRDLLVALCGNSSSLPDCARELDRLVSSHGQVQGFYDRYVPYARKLYDGFFMVRWPRRDLDWTSAAPSILHAPFVDPRDAHVASYLKTNIEDEWKWNGWHLSLDFQPNDTGSTSHVEFEPGQTPHVIVEDNVIVMDANQPLTEYDSQWAIRHEYGHILGFPDCYVEFYDTEQEAMISYQLDITNLMCSRRGELQQKHFDQLKKTYFR